MREPKDNSFGAYQELNVHLSRIQDLEKKVAEQGQSILALQFLTTVITIMFIIVPQAYNIIKFILEATRP